MREYKEDSTKGSARIMPVNYKGDVLVQAWVDARQLAVISEWLDNSGYRTKHMSELIKVTIEEVASQLIDTGKVNKIEFTKEARELLTMKYRAALNPSGRGERNLLHNLHLDEVRRSNVYRDEKVKTIYNGGIEELVRGQVLTYQEMERVEREQKMKAETERQKKEARKTAVDYKEDDKAIIDVEENVRRMKAYDDKLKDMP